MTPNEHKLIVYMLAQQTVRFKALLELLRARGILENDDFAAFEHLAEAQSGDELLAAIAEQYTEFAVSLGLQDSLPKSG